MCLSAFISVYCPIHRQQILHDHIGLEANVFDGLLVTELDVPWPVLSLEKFSTWILIQNLLFKRGSMCHLELLVWFLWWQRRVAARLSLHTLSLSHTSMVLEEGSCLLHLRFHSRSCWLLVPHRKSQRNRFAWFTWPKSLLRLTFLLLFLLLPRLYLCPILSCYLLLYSMIRL